MVMAPCLDIERQKKQYQYILKKYVTKMQDNILEIVLVLIMLQASCV